MLQPALWYNHVQTQDLLLPPSPPPICPQSLTRDIKGAGVGRGRSRCWSSPVSCAPTEFSHGSDLSNMSAASVTFHGSPFSGENTPVGAPEPKMSLLHNNNGAWGGGLPRRGDEAWWEEGGRAGKCMCYVWNTSSLRKIHRAVSLESYPHFFLDGCNY